MIFVVQCSIWRLKSQNLVTGLHPTVALWPQINIIGSSACIPCSRRTQQIKSTKFLLQSSEEEIADFKWNTVFYGRFKIPLVCAFWMCLLDLIRIWTKNSGNSSSLRAVAAHDLVMGWLKHSSSSCLPRPRCYLRAIYRDKEADSSECCLAQARCGGGQVIRDRATLCPRPGVREQAAG